MARTFTDASSKYLACDAAVVTAKPFTICCWCYADTDAASVRQMPMGLGNGSVQNDQVYIDYKTDWPGAGDHTFRVVYRNASGADTQQNTDASSYAWQHVAVTISSAANLKLYLNGSGSAGVTATHHPSGLDKTSIGCGIRNATYDWYHWEGYIAEAAIWDIDLTAAEVAALAAGFSPLFIRPANLKAYWPLIRKGSIVNNPDLVGGFDMTDYNTPGDTSHCRIRRPAPGLIPALTQPISEIPVLMMHYKKMRVA